MTERLFLENNYLRNFEARITRITESSIIMNRTGFYPEGGGQPCDLGVIIAKDQTFNVIDVRQYKGEIHHVVESANDLSSLKCGSFVKCVIDWDRRYRLMRAHTAQHIISRYFQINYSANTVSTQLKAETSRLDFQPLGKLSKIDLQEISDGINCMVQKNLSVDTFFLPRGEAIKYLKEKGYQIKYLSMVPKSVQKLRIVAINDFDWAACAGTHVSNTSEIGNIILERIKNKGKLRERIYYSVKP